MGIAWGIVLLLLSLLAWGGQTIVWLAPATGERLGLVETSSAVDSVFAADARGEALWDVLALWTMVVAGVLLVLDHPAWAYFGLIGGGVYGYFAGRGILTRNELRRRGVLIGTPQNVRVGYAFLAVWGLMAVITIVAAVVALPVP